jgi:hypothetical protein
MRVHDQDRLLKKTSWIRIDGIRKVRQDIVNIPTVGKVFTSQPWARCFSNAVNGSFPESVRRDRHPFRQAFQA